ncbi:MAG TPA: hypothetical protein HA252_06260 [Candidatus Diapherotrites archaeon]|uniref:Holliday junction resolvase n=1 Tax=Candidatus Iainarchaeum sp. TaxID=3101447 RepID=A0A7J4JGV7_9ARCH|nr:hypothetical protein [Candidatus Diapherotrites archaeon]HIH16981.1 hypothetical protein [Candidatus Diapherotrites archaeon]
MAHYKKGADAERELIHLLFDKGFSVVRVAGSGKTALPAPDLLALHKSRILAFECKAWASDSIHLPVSQMQELLSWCERAGAEVFIAWKYPRRGWFFLKPEHFSKAEKNYSISLRHAVAKAIDLEVLTGRMAVLPH